MKISEEIMSMIGAKEFVIAPITEASNLYTDLGYDSLAFMRLLLEIEEAYSIQFELMEIGACLRLDQLIALVERKIKRSVND